MDEFSDGKAIFSNLQNVVWSKVDDPNKWEVQEPYGYFRYDMGLDAWVQNKEDTNGVAFYTMPPQKEWVGLTDEDIAKAVSHLYESQVARDMGFNDDLVTARAIEAKLREKNHD